MCFEQICNPLLGSADMCLQMATGNLQKFFSQIWRDPVLDPVVFIAAHFLCSQGPTKLFI